MYPSVLGDPLQADNPEREGNGCQSFQTRTKTFGPGLPSLSDSQIRRCGQVKLPSIPSQPTYCLPLSPKHSH